MKLILITPPTYFVEEDKIITDLFEEGLDILHLRKPNTAPIFAERLLSLIPEQYHKRIVVHGHFYLKDEYRLKGVHLSERNPNIPENFKGHISRSCHTLEEIKIHKRNYDYILFSPDFEHFTDKTFHANHTPEELKKAHKAGIIDKKVIALGGINLDNARQAKEFGFGGVAIMSDVWNKFNTCTDSDYTQLIQHFKKLKKLVD